jgi:hypothetical protein
MDRSGNTVRRATVRIAVIALLLTACSSGGSTASPAVARSHRPTTPPPSPDAPSLPIPNGTFDATETRKEALAAGFSSKEITAAYGPDGTMPVTLVLDDGVYQVFGVGDDGVKELGDKGTYTATDTRWVAASESEGCSGCVYTFRWSFDGTVLSLELLRGSKGPEDFRQVQLVAEHDYVKVG